MRVVREGGMALLALLAGAGVLPAEIRFYERVEQAVVRQDRSRLQEYRGVLRRESDTSLPVAVSRAYALAYVSSRLAPLLPRGSQEREGLLEEAARALELRVRSHPRDAEAHALLGSVYGSLISASRWKAVTLGPKVAAAFRRAEELAPDNPRVALQKGVSLLFVPRALGGGPQAAERELRRAEALFARQPGSTPWPDWGRFDVLVWLGQVRERQDDPAAARAYYRKALALEPESAWVKRLLGGIP